MLDLIIECDRCDEKIRIGKIPDKKLSNTMNQKGWMVHSHLKVTEQDLCPKCAAKLVEFRKH